MIWVVSSNILWRSLALFMNDKWAGHRSMGSAINWNQAPCLRRHRPRGPEISLFRWVGMCFLKGSTGGDGSERSVIPWPFVVSANKNDFRNGYFGLALTMQVQPGAQSHAGFTGPHHKSTSPGCAHDHPRPPPPRSCLPTQGLRSEYKAERNECLCLRAALGQVTVCPGRGKLLCVSGLLIASSRLQLRPYVLEERFILLIVLVTSCEDYAC